MRAARQVVQLYQLGPDDLIVSAPPGPGLQQLVDDALDADSRVPAIAQTPLDIDLLGRQLATALGGEAAQQAAFGAQLVRALPMRRPQPWWRAWPLGLRRQFGRWLFTGKTHDWAADGLSQMLMLARAPENAQDAELGTELGAKIAHNARRAAARFGALPPDARLAPPERAACLDWLQAGLRAGAGAQIEAALRRATAGVLAQAQAQPHAPARTALPASAMPYFAAELAQTAARGAHLLGAAETPSALCLLSTGPELAPALPAVQFWVSKTAAQAGDCSAVSATATAFEG